MAYSTAEFRVACDIELNKMAMPRLQTQQISMNSMTNIMRLTGNHSVATLRRNYRKYAEAHHLPLPTMRRMVEAEKSSKVKEAWVDVQDAVHFLQSRNNKHVGEFLSRVLQTQAALDTNDKVTSRHLKYPRWKVEYIIGDKSSLKIPTLESRGI